MHRDLNKPYICKIEKIINETPTIRTLFFSDKIMANSLPGQFAMVWIPGINELPMSIMISQEQNKAAFTIRKHGTGSTALYSSNVGQLIGIRGPYGNSFDIKSGKLLLAGGGTGLVPLMRLLKFIKSTDDITLLIGAKTKQEVFFESLAKNMLKKNRHNIIITTNDGSYGKKGFITDIVNTLLQKINFDGIYTCGPELMMFNTVKLAIQKKIFIQASIERIMKCGIGLCGSCSMNDTIVCRDGTVFDGSFLLQRNEFGFIYRDKTGAMKNY